MSTRPMAVTVRPPNKWAALATVCVALLVIALNTTAINAAIPSIADELHLPTSTLGWAINAYMLAVAALVVIGGQLGDVLGRRRHFLVGLGVFATGSLGVATATSGTPLLLGRTLQGIAAAMLMPATMAIINEVFPKAERGTAMGVWGALGGLGFALGPLFGGFLTDTIGWRSIFWSDVVLLALTTTMALALLRGLPGVRSVKPPVDVFGAAALAVGLFLLVLSLERLRDWRPAAVLGGLAAGVGCLVLFTAHERRTPFPLVHLSSFRDRIFVGGNLATAASTVALIGVPFFFNLYVQSPALLAYSALRASAILLAFGLSMFAVALVGGRLADRFGYRLPIVAGLGLQAAGCFLFSRFTASTQSSEMWVPLILTGLGSGLSFSTTSAVGMNAVPDEQAGEASGVINMSRYLGAAVGIALGTMLYLGAGISMLNESLTAAKIDPVQEAHLDAALAGSPSAIDRTIGALGGHTRDAFVDGVKRGTVTGFARAMQMIAAVCLGAALMSVWLLKPRPSKPARP